MTEALSSEGPLQFGRRKPGAEPRERPTAYGVAVREDGRIACVRVTRDGEPPYLDLPGGGVDPGEDLEAALVREFGEETGLVVAAGRLLARCRQFMVMESGEAVNNLSALLEARLTGEDPALKIEDDHALVWLAPLEAVSCLRLDSQAWAVAAWLRTR